MTAKRQATLAGTEGKPKGKPLGHLASAKVDSGLILAANGS